jgi:hypothetical protein
MAVEAFPVVALASATEERSPRTGRPCPRRVSYVDGHDDARGAAVHEALDIFAPRGSEVRAPEAGEVIGVGTSAKGGRWVRLWSPASNRTYYFSHLHDVFVAAGRTVRAGERIASVGNTGNAARTCPHLHLRAAKRRDAKRGAAWVRMGPAVRLYEELSAVDPRGAGETPAEGAATMAAAETLSAAEVAEYERLRAWLADILMWFGSEGAGEWRAQLTPVGLEAWQHDVEVMQARLSDQLRLLDLAWGQGRRRTALRSAHAFASAARTQLRVLEENAKRLGATLTGRLWTAYGDLTSLGDRLIKSASVGVFVASAVGLWLLVRIFGR